MFKLKIVEYSIGYKKIHQEFTKKNWGKEKRGDPRYLQYKHRSENPNVIKNLIIAIFEDKVIGQIGLIPTDLMFKTKKLPCYWICDLMVESEYRKKGIAIELYKYVMKRNILLMGSYPSPKAELLDRLLKFKKIVGPNIWYFPVNFNSLLKFKYQRSFKYLPNFFLRIAEKLYLFFFDIKITLFSNIKFQGWEELLDIHDKFQAEIKEPRIIHDKKFLDWRGNGLKGYSKKLKGLKRKDDSYLFFEEASDCLYVYDWKIKNQKVAKDLCSQLVSISIEYKKNRIQLTTNNIEQEKILERIGFRKFNNPITLYYYTLNPDYVMDSFHFTLYDSDGNL